MASQSQQQPWWTRDKQAGLQNRIKAVQRLNDPTTNADELLKGSKVLIVILLTFTGLLGAISYFKSFSTSFPIEAAIVMALALTIAIEWGKNYCFTWSIRIPFFRGWGHIQQTSANTVMWAGLLLIAAATFTMSFINSTRGGKQLSIMMSQERDASPFVANTASIDSLIGSTQKNIETAAGTKWKGTTTRTSQQAIKSHSESIAALNRQREATISQQRADWENEQSRKSANSNYAANLVLASGGWVELLQILLILVRVACEKALDDRLPSPAQDQQEEKSGIGFRPSGYRVAGAEHIAPPPPPEQEQPRRPIGFFRQEQPPEQPTVPRKNTVEQCSTAETVRTAAVPEHTVPTSSASVLADVKEWQKRATQCFHRALNQQREEFRHDNWRRCTCFCIMLQAVGVEVIRDDENMILQFKAPAEYRTDQDVIHVIQEQKSRLEMIGKRREA